MSWVKGGGSSHSIRTSPSGGFSSQGEQWLRLFANTQTIEFKFAYSGLFFRRAYFFSSASGLSVRPGSDGGRPLSDCPARLASMPRFASSAWRFQRPDFLGRGWCRGGLHQSPSVPAVRFRWFGAASWAPGEASSGPSPTPSTSFRASFYRSSPWLWWALQPDRGHQQRAHRGQCGLGGVSGWPELNRWAGVGVDPV